MARIRTLKPEFWDSPSTAKADLAVRLTFLSMWNWADDSGHGTANLKELEAFAFPNDEVAELPRRSRGNSAGAAGGWRNFAEICGEVQECYGVRFYRVDGRPYYWIPSFKKHQSKDFRPTSKYPPHEEGEFYDVTTGNPVQGGNNAPHNPPPTGGPSAPSSGNSAPYAGDSALGTGEEGNRGTGDKDTYSPATPSSDVVIADEPDLFDEFWAAYPRKVSKKNARVKFKAACKRASAQEIIEGAQRLAADPNLPADQNYIPYPDSWLNGDRWEDGPLPSRLGNTTTTADQRRADNVRRISQHQAWTPEQATASTWGEEGMKALGR